MVWKHTKQQLWAIKRCLSSAFSAGRAGTVEQARHSEKGNFEKHQPPTQEVVSKFSLSTYLSGFILYRPHNEMEQESEPLFYA
jgi:hypothetical protein